MGWICRVKKSDVRCACLSMRLEEWSSCGVHGGTAASGVGKR